MESFVRDAISRNVGAIPTSLPAQSDVIRERPVEATPPKQEYHSGDTPESFIDVKDAKILVIGVGGMGNNAIHRLNTLGVKGAITIAVNTDKVHLTNRSSDKKILIGKDITRGLGAGGYPSVGKRAAEESNYELTQAVQDADMIFLVAGMGGGTGTGAAPVVAKIGKRLNKIVIAVVTMPFKIEGSRISKAEDGLAELRQYADTVIVIENDKLLEVAGEMPLQQAFAVADEIIVTMIKGISETIATPSLVNLDYADVKAVMSNGGVAVIGVGESSSAARAREAVQEAMSNPLLDVDYKGASGALIHITGGLDMKLGEINEIGEFVSKHLDPDAQTIWGARVNEDLHGKIRVITIITGVSSPFVLGPPKMNMSASTLGEKLGIEML